MPILPFDSRHGYSIGATAVVDSLRNINAVGGTFAGRVSVAGGLTTSELFVSGVLTAGTVSATTYRNLPVASGSQTGVASFDSNFTVSSAGQVTTRFFINSQNVGSIAFNIFGRNGIQLVQNEDGEGNDTIRIGLVAGITGDTVVAGTNVGVSRSGKTVTISSTHPLASASATGVASFGNEFIVSAAGAVSLTGNYVRSFNGSTGAVVYSPRLATTALTGVASFNDTHFSVTTTGHVLLASAYQVTGDTIVAGTNIGTSRSGRTVTVSSTHPIATSSVTGVASFNNQFVVSAAGAVGLTSNYIISANSLTGAIEVSGSTGILVETIAASKRILVSLKTSNFNNATANITTFDTNSNSFVGVNGFSYDSGSGNLKLSGNVVLADPQANISFGDGTTQSTAARIRLASTTVTGNASFNNVHFSIGSSGHVSLASPYTATGDTIVAGTNVGISRSGNSVTVSSTHPIATSSVTGVASFGNEFLVSAAGAVSLTGNYVRSFNGSTGAVTYSPRLATTTLTGEASFNNVHFTVASTGHVSLASAYQVTGDTVVAGTNVGISRSGNSVTVSSTHPIASASATGVASFNSSDFVVSAAGAVSLTDVFTGGVTCTAAVSVGGTLTAHSMFVSQGVTLNSRASLVGGATAAHLFVGAGTTLNSSLYVGGNSTLGGGTANTITLPSGQVMKTYRAETSSTSTYTLFTESIFTYSSADILIQAEKWGDGSVSSGFLYGTVAVHNTRISAVANPVGFGVNHVQYGSVFTGSTAASYDIDSDGAGGWRLRVTPNSTYVTTLRVQAVLSPNNGGSGF